MDSRRRIIALSLALFALISGAHATAGLAAGLGNSVANTIFDPINRAANPVFGSSVAGSLLTGAASGLSAAAGIGSSATPTAGLGGLLGGHTGALTSGVGAGVNGVLGGVGGLANGVLGAAGLGGSGIGGISSGALNEVGSLATGILGGGGAVAAPLAGAGGALAAGGAALAGGAAASSAANAATLGGGLAGAGLAGGPAAAAAAAASAGGANGAFPGAAGLRAGFPGAAGFGGGLGGLGGPFGGLASAGGALAGGPAAAAAAGGALGAAAAGRAAAGSAAATGLAGAPGLGMANAGLLPASDLLVGSDLVSQGSSGLAAAAAAAAGGAASSSLGIGNLAAAANLASGAEPTSLALADSSAGLLSGPLTASLANSELGREQLANDAYDNAQAEAAIAGADMMAHGANNARSASLASNAYRQAKLASARDRVNIAGTVQNSARISDAAIATHDAATKAEDSLLGSELAVDSAATVLDSDAAYIPPVTNSLLRSLPYGRLGLRNIVPKPLTYPSSILPDVWLNGLPVNYLNSPLRALQYGANYPYFNNGLGLGLGFGFGFGLGGALNGGQYLSNWGPASGIASAGPLPFDQLQSNSELAGQLLNGQPFWAANGWPINALVMDPAAAYLANGPMSGSSVYPVLANGQLEAQDEINAANLLTMKQQNGAGMLSTYFGFGRMNPVPLLTGTVSSVNLNPTTTIGTTYPIGSALVIEPRDSYFQDYIDNASSRQNYDEREQ